MSNSVTKEIDQDEIKEFSALDRDVQELIRCAIEVRQRAYCPYSGFKVGAALRTTTGPIITGCNVENATYSPSVCAERTAIYKAISEGYQEFTACAVVGQKENGFVSPCGVCRQNLAEFANKDFPVYMTNPTGDTVLISSIYKLLPNGMYGIINFS